MAINKKAGAFSFEIEEKDGDSFESENAGHDVEERFVHEGAAGSE